MHIKHPVLLTLFTLGGSAARAGTLQVRELVAPAHPVPGAEKVLILEPTGTGGHAFASALQRTLGDEGLGTGSGPTVSDGLMAPRITASRMTEARQLTSELAVELAAKHGVQIIATGEVSGVEMSFREWEEERTRKERTDSGEKEIKYNVPCAAREVEVKSWYALFSATGEIIVNDDATRMVTSSDCDEYGDDPLKLDSAAALTQPLVDAAAFNFALQWRPHYRSASYPIFEDGDSGGVLADLKRGSWDAAATHAAAALGKQPYDYALQHHTALLLAMTGHYSDAVTQLQLVYRYTGDAAFQDLTRAIEQRQAAAAALAQLYQLSPQPRALDALAPQLAISQEIVARPLPEGRATVVRSLLDRPVELADGPKKGATVAAVPRGLQVFATAEEGKMSLVTLPDGAPGGWVPNRNLKDL